MAGLGSQPQRYTSSMQITLDAETEQILQRELEQGRYTSPEQALAYAVRLLAQQAEDDWLLRNREAIQAALEESMAAEARGESYSWEEVESILNQRRAERASRAA